MVAATLFLLPQFVSDPWIAGQDEDLPVVPEASSATVVPSTAAELTRFRQDSQGVLAEIISLRERLIERSVELWADVEFQQALNRVEEGDERYSYGEYAASLEHYRAARELLAGLEERGQQILVEALDKTREAIVSLNVVVATDSITLAGAIAPEDSEVQQLAGRVETLEQVSIHIDAGDQALAADRFSEARDQYQQAVALDPQLERSSRSLKKAKREVTASVYRAHMSRGFAAMENQDFAAARESFNQAGKVYPGDAAVSQALEQVANLESGNQVSAELARAAELESREEWREARAIYEGVLQKDPSLSDAKVRLIPVRVRDDLDRQLAAYIAEPLSLSSQNEFQAAQRAVKDAQGIPNPGPRLSDQIDQLQSILQVANSPVDVVFRSDNETHVVLFRIADLGRFEQKSVKLRPGKYVIAGTRGGYRDVRVEFTITGAPLPAPIVVRCEEPVG